MKIIISSLCISSFVLCNCDCVIALAFKTIIIPKKKSNGKSRNNERYPVRNYKDEQSKENKDELFKDNKDEQSKDNKSEQSKDNKSEQSKDNKSEQSKDNKDEQSKNNKDEQSKDGKKGEDKKKSSKKTKPSKPNPQKLLEGLYISLGLGADMSETNVTTESQEAVNLETIKEKDDTESQEAADPDETTEEKTEPQETTKPEETTKEETESTESAEAANPEETAKEEGDLESSYEEFFKNNKKNDGWHLKNFYMNNKQATIKLSANKKAKIADFSQTLPMLSVAVGYGKFLSDTSNFYFGGELVIDLGKSSKKQKCFKNWEQEYARLNKPDAYDEDGFFDTINKSGISYSFAVRGGYYLKNMTAMVYLKLGAAKVNAEIASRSKYPEDPTICDDNTKISKFVPELTIGVEKMVCETVSLKVEFGCRLRTDISGSLRSQCYIQDPDGETRYDCKSKIKLETGGYVARISASWHIS
ncbi:hypothetical protein FACS189472_03080 [Alphaproteobacteria bacterium]|nr:hypothetical protein FACS189472_03080 [Alphaproteobacteria bacterium]